ncbi:MAG: hypothetical protein WBE48_26580 [Xanthobacteraceae bacterium]
MLERASGYLTKTSDLAQQAPAEMRGEFVAFERESRHGFDRRRDDQDAP